MIYFKERFSLSLNVIFYIFSASTAVLIFFICFCVLTPPQVIGATPGDGKTIASSDSQLIIEFDRPVERRELEHVISPTAYGEWKFEGPLLNDHFFTKLVFTPAVSFKPGTEYLVQLKNIKSFISPGLNSFSYSFKTLPATKEKEQLASNNNFNAINSAYTDESSQVTMLKTSFHWQDYPLSCEAASLKIALSAKGINASEDDILKKIGDDPTPRKNNVWGNPYQYFVGDLSGKMCSTGYGVYWLAVAKAASNWRPAEYFSNWTLGNLVSEIKSGNPVIFWGVVPVGRLTDCSWYTNAGLYVKAYKETHVRVVVGFVGPATNPSKIIIEDPLAGELYWDTGKFLTNWKIYDNSGVSIK